MPKLNRMSRRIVSRLALRLSTDGQRTSSVRPQSPKRTSVVPRPSQSLFEVVMAAFVVMTRLSQMASAGGGRRR